MQKEMVINPEWVNAPYEEVIMNYDGRSLRGIVLGNRYRTVEDSEAHRNPIPKFIERVIDESTT